MRKKFIQRLGSLVAPVFQRLAKFLYAISLACVRFSDSLVVRVPPPQPARNEGLDLSPFQIDERFSSVVDGRFDYPPVFDLFSRPMMGVRVVEPTQLEKFIDTFTFKHLVQNGDITPKLATNLKNVCDQFKTRRTHDPELDRMCS